MFALELELLTGRYVATAWNDRSRGEWPPHPARVFSALVDACHQAVPPDPAELAALRWLESQPAPSLCASDAAMREVVTVFVPVNDASVTKDKDVAVSAKEPSKGQVADGRAVLPERRVRQPRTFPSVCPTDPTVHLVWPQAPSPADREALRALSRRVVRVGHSSTLVRCAVADQAPSPTWVPDTAGLQVLRVPRPGQLDELQAEWLRHRETEPRVLPCAFQRYRDDAARTERDMAMEVDRGVFGDDWIVLRRIDGPRMPLTRAVDLSRAVRDALMVHADQPAAPILTGHAEEGGALPVPHLAVVPLSFVAHPHADGAVLGVALVLPRAAAEEERRAVLRAVGRWEQSCRQDEEETPRLMVWMGAAGDLALERVAWGQPQRNLQASTWCGPARTWASVTPIALDRNPGDLRSRDPQAAARAYDLAAATIARACVHVGLPEPVEVSVHPSVLVAGSAKAQHFPTFPPGEGRTRRVKVHAQVRFAEAVAGPVLLGAGRYHGLGLMRPVGEG